MKCTMHEPEKSFGGGPTKGDNGRGLAADIDPNHRGFEMWSSGVPGVYNCKGERFQIINPASVSVYIGMVTYRMKY